MALRLIQVGLGGIGGHWFRTVLNSNTEVEVVAWVEIVEEALQRAIEKWPLPQERCFSSLEAALEAYEADAVLITASLAGHVPSARTALLAGKHVLMEKPFAPTIQEARELVTLAQEQQRILMISQNYRFFPRALAARQYVQEKTLGELGTVTVDFRHYANRAPVETNRHYHIWQPLLADMSIHHFDLMRYVLKQEPVSISCTSWNPAWSRFVEPPAAAATIRFDGGAVVTYRGSWVSPGQPTSWTGDWHMEFTDGELIWNDRSEIGGVTNNIFVRRLGEELAPVESPALVPTDFAGSLTAFVQAIRLGSEPGSSGRDNLKTLALMFAAIASAEQQGLPIEIASLL
ncbi:Gfo/Idh/MocA family protein [Ktedonobacter racemifer]|uniref:Oxidoreductase domain protein n=1 Tax=Ktedonobacter racemifer DSM 44963 TaxID=485913 RepID=D6TVE2_KTERA|nr:Gfo/Idh/MocA family oxidoreductase [Ktedonobacter racemifer]EFH84242.1 oxidoreductase domain protein [Ktedonobacter racemifer DSM 44963]